MGTRLYAKINLYLLENIDVNSIQIQNANKGIHSKVTVQDPVESNGTLTRQMLQNKLDQIDKKNEELDNILAEAEKAILNDLEIRNTSYLNMCTSLLNAGLISEIFPQRPPLSNIYFIDQFDIFAQDLNNVENWHENVDTNYASCLDFYLTSTVKQPEYVTLSFDDDFYDIVIPLHLYIENKYEALEPIVDSLYDAIPTYIYDMAESIHVIGEYTKACVVLVKDPDKYFDAVYIKHFNNPDNNSFITFKENWTNQLIEHNILSQTVVDKYHQLLTEYNEIADFDYEVMRYTFSKVFEERVNAVKNNDNDAIATANDKLLNIIDPKYRIPKETSDTSLQLTFVQGSSTRQSSAAIARAGLILAELELDKSIREGKDLVDQVGKKKKVAIKRREVNLANSHANSKMGMSPNELPPKSNLFGMLYDQANAIPNPTTKYGKQLSKNATVERAYFDVEKALGETVSPVEELSVQQKIKVFEDLAKGNNTSLISTGSLDEKHLSGVKRLIDDYERLGKISEIPSLPPGNVEGMLREHPFYNRDQKYVPDVTFDKATQATADAKKYNKVKNEVNATEIDKHPYRNNPDPEPIDPEQTRSVQERKYLEKKLKNYELPKSPEIVVPNTTTPTIPNDIPKPNPNPINIGDIAGLTKQNIVGKTARDTAAKTNNRFRRSADVLNKGEKGKQFAQWSGKLEELINKRITLPGNVDAKELKLKIYANRKKNGPLMPDSDLSITQKEIDAAINKVKTETGTTKNNVLNYVLNESPEDEVAKLAKNIINDVPISPSIYIPNKVIEETTSTALQVRNSAFQVIDFVPGSATAGTIAEAINDVAKKVGKSATAIAKEVGAKVGKKVNAKSSLGMTTHVDFMTSLILFEFFAMFMEICARVVIYGVFGSLADIVAYLVKGDFNADLGITGNVFLRGLNSSEKTKPFIGFAYLFLDIGRDPVISEERKEYLQNNLSHRGHNLHPLTVLEYLTDFDKARDGLRQLPLKISDPNLQTIFLNIDKIEQHIMDGLLGESWLNYILGGLASKAINAASKAINE